jgi:uncharacterized protein YaaQ
MKLILAIVNSDMVETVSRALVEKSYPVTQISSLGGFLRRGSTTLVIGVDAPQVPGVLATIKGVVPQTPRSDPNNPAADSSHYVTLFVLDASQYVQI